MKEEYQHIFKKGGPHFSGKTSATTKQEHTFEKVQQAYFCQI